MINFIKNIGLPELIIAAVIILLFFGGKKLKELSHGLGVSAKELKKIKQEFGDKPDTRSKKGGVS